MTTPAPLLRSTAPPWWAPHVYPGESRHCQTMRADLRRDLADFDPDLADTVELCAAELLANAVRYTASGHGGEVYVRLRMPAPGVLRLDVADGGRTDTVPHIPHRDTADWLTAEGQRGLHLVQALTHRWGYHNPNAHQHCNLGLIVWTEYHL